MFLQTWTSSQLLIDMFNSEFQSSNHGSDRCDRLQFELTRIISLSTEDRCISSGTPASWIKRLVQYKNCSPWTSKIIFIVALKTKRPIIRFKKKISNPSFWFYKYTSIYHQLLSNHCWNLGHRLFRRKNDIKSH